MPMIEIPDVLFGRLQRLASPLVDTPATVVERLVNHYESAKNNRSFPTPSNQKAAPNTSGTAVRQFDPSSPPDLRHTRVITANFGSQPADGWNNLVHVAHIEAFSCLKDVDGLRRVTKSNFIVGRPSLEEIKRGYRYIPQIDISIQNVDAKYALSNTFRLAKQLQIPFCVDFEWMQKAEAAYPGEKGRLSWKP